jgi:hypothetical protein
MLINLVLILRLLRIVSIIILIQYLVKLLRHPINLLPLHRVDTRTPLRLFLHLLEFLIIHLHILIYAIQKIQIWLELQTRLLRRLRRPSFGQRRLVRRDLLQL